jgi:hypothetical protein
MSSLYGNNYTVVAANGQAPVDGPVQVNNFLIQSATGAVAYTIPTSMCGAIIAIPVLTNQGANVVTITLPNPATNPGFNCKFVLTGDQFDASTINIDGGANSTFHPVQIRNANALTTSAICRGVSFLVAGTAVAGDFAEVVSDGTKYRASITSSVAASVGAVANAA